MEIVSEIIKIKSSKMPPDTDFIEGEILKSGNIPLRWAIIDVNNNELTLSVSLEKR